MRLKHNRKLRVFHGLLNYGTQAGFLAKGLREHGVKAKSVVSYDRFKRVADVELLKGGNILKKLSNRILNRMRLTYYFFKFDIFHFYYGSTLFSNQLDLPFYHIMGKKVIMHYLGNDVQGYKKSIEKYKWTNMLAYSGNEDIFSHDSKIEKRLEFESRHVDLKLVCAPCYSEFVPGSKVIPLAIDTKSYAFTKHPQHEILEIMHAPTHRAVKGTNYIIAAIEKLISEGYPVRVNLVENVTHDQLKEEYKKCDFFIDQIMGGWYGTAAIEAMALGRPVICSIRKSYFEYIDFGAEIPIIHADPDCIYDSVLYLIKNRLKLPEIGLFSRQFVEKIHDHKKIAGELIQYYKSLY